MHLTLANFGLVVVGLLIYILIKLVKIQKKKKSEFDLKIYFKENYLQLILCTLTAFTVMYFGDSISEGMLDIHIHKDSHYYKLYALAAGFNNQVLFNELMKKNNGK